MHSPSEAAAVRATTTTLRRVIALFIVMLHACDEAIWLPCVTLKRCSTRRFPIRRRSHCRQTESAQQAARRPHPPSATADRCHTRVAQGELGEAAAEHANDPREIACIVQETSNPPPLERWELRTVYTGAPEGAQRSRPPQLPATGDESRQRIQRVEM